MIDALDLAFAWVGLATVVLMCALVAGGLLLLLVDRIRPRPAPRVPTSDADLTLLVTRRADRQQRQRDPYNWD